MFIERKRFIRSGHFWRSRLRFRVRVGNSVAQRIVETGRMVRCSTFHQPTPRTRHRPYGWQWTWKILTWSPVQWLLTAESRLLASNGDNIEALIIHLQCCNERMCVSQSTRPLRAICSMLSLAVHNDDDIRNAFDTVFHYVVIAHYSFHLRERASSA